MANNRLQGTGTLKVGRASKVLFRSAVLRKRSPVPEPGVRQEVRMRTVTVFTLLSVLCLSLYSSGHNCNLADATVENLIKSKASALKCEEYCQFRLYDALDDVDGDGKEDFIVIFTVEGPEGGNFHESYMYVFLSSSKDQKPQVVKVGERGQRDPASVSAQQGKIVITTLEYLPKDPMCCPSGHGEVVFSLKGGKLIETKTPA